MNSGSNRVILRYPSSNNDKECVDLFSDGMNT
jgi:hypothetical protein